MTEQARLPYHALFPEALKPLREASEALKKASVGRQLIDLVYLRVSQINGCAYCVDLHWHDLIEQGDDLQRLNSLVTWHEVSFFSERERAALAWAEELTHIAETHASDEAFAAVHKHFADKEVAELTYAIALMNAWNRLAISMRQPVARRAVKVAA
ncbi:MAG: Transposase [Rhizobacter sp.]|nr:Transposase [Rhizobacter sp.]